MYPARVGNKVVSLYENNDRIVYHEQHGGFERETLAFWASCCRKGGIAIDIGAYTGIYCISAALLGMKSYAFEPLPGNYDRLLMNIAHNRAEVSAFRLAISDEEGLAALYSSGTAGMTSGASLLKADHILAMVDTYRLDDLVDKADLIKIDVERMEPAVLAGAQRVLETYHPTLIIEVLGDEERKAVEAALPGYEPATLLDGRNLIMLPILLGG